MLSLDSVSFRSGDRVLLDAVSFSLAPGQFYGVIGHNGAGKSTLIRLLGGELLPSSGAVLLDGAAVHAFSAKARARRIASLPQKLPDAADFLVRELVMLGRFPWQGWLQRPSAEDVACVEAAMAQTDVARFAAQPVNTLSGGERQRVWRELRCWCCRRRRAMTRSAFWRHWRVRRRWPWVCICRNTDALRCQYWRSPAGSCLSADCACCPSPYWPNRRWKR